MTTQRALSVVVLTIVTIIAVLYGYAYLNRKNREGYFRVAGTSLASLRTLWLKEGAAWPPPDAARYTGNAKLAGRAIALDTNITRSVVYVCKDCIPFDMRIHQRMP
jgi:hypothetical protein